MQQNVQKFGPERPEIYVIWWNDGLLGYNYMWVMNNNQFRSLSEFYIIIFLNKLKVVENKNKKINIQKLKQRVGHGGVYMYANRIIAD